MNQKDVQEHLCDDGKIYNQRTKRCIKDSPHNRRKINSPTKICNDGKIYNYKSRRCIKDSPSNRRKILTTTTPIKKCEEGKIFNYGTNRCIKDTPINRRKRKLRYSPMECEEGKIYNYRTNRCIKDSPANRFKSKIPSNLIYDNFLKPLPDTLEDVDLFKSSKKYLSGVRKLAYYYNMDLDMQVLLFYDIHNLEKRCERYDIEEDSSIKGVDFLKEIIDYNEENSDSMIDVFVEYKPLGNKKISKFPNNRKIKKREIFFKEGSGLDSVNKFIQKCINVQNYEIVSDDCEYQYMRAHYTDFRHNFKITKIFSDYFNDRSKYKDEIRDFIENSDSFIDDILDIPKMKKQFDNIEDESIKDKIISYYKDDVIKRKDMYDNKELGKFEFMVSVSSHIMDLYLMGRLFKTFEVDPDDPVRGHHNDKVQKAIIYAGYAHCVDYASLLEILGFEKIFETSGYQKTFEIGSFEDHIEGKCLNIEDLRLSLK